MSYFGSVHCGYCGKRGHNRLGCPERKKAAREDPDGYTARQLKREAETRKRAVEARRCSYCNESGHNRRGCKQLKKDIELLKNTQEMYQVDFESAVTNSGMGVGSLIKISYGESQAPWSRYILAMVTSVNWDEVDFTINKSNNYQFGNKSVLTTRVVSAAGDWNNSWNQPPGHNDRRNVTAGEVAGLLPSVVYSQGGPDATARTRVQVVSPTSSVNPRPMTPEISNHVSRTFNLFPDKRDDRWQRMRIDPSDSLWPPGVDS